jgi:ABC-type spermidine/putrescine transport system permease subunit II
MNLLITFLIGIIVLNIVTIAELLRIPPDLVAVLSPSFGSPTLRIALAGAWAIAFSILAIDLIRRRAWAFRWLLPMVTLYALSGLALGAVFSRSDFDRSRFPFLIAQTILVLVLLAIWVRIGVRKVTRGKHNS